jgi:alpha-L-rhamnosidase
MFGGGLVWFYRKLAGMNTDPDHPGYKNIIFKPQPVADLTYASYSNLTPFGIGGIRWELKADQFLMDITVPVGSTATVYIPAKEAGEVMESGKIINQKSENIAFLRMEGNYAVFTVNSGIYSFKSEYTLIDN